VFTAQIFPAPLFATMTKEELDQRLNSWVLEVPKGSGRRFYSNPSPISDGELQYTIRQTAIVTGKPISLDKKLLTETLSLTPGADTATLDMDNLELLLGNFDSEYQNKLKSHSS
jgi:hypothetical protein